MAKSEYPFLAYSTFYFEEQRLETIKDFYLLARENYHYDFAEREHGTKPGLVPLITFFTINTNTSFLFCIRFI